MPALVSTGAFLLNAVMIVSRVVPRDWAGLAPATFDNFDKIDRIKILPDLDSNQDKQNHHLNLDRTRIQDPLILFPMRTRPAGNQKEIIYL